MLLMLNMSPVVRGYVDYYADTLCLMLHCRSHIDYCHADATATTPLILRPLLRCRLLMSPVSCHMLIAGVTSYALQLLTEVRARCRDADVAMPCCYAAAIISPLLERC